MSVKSLLKTAASFGFAFFRVYNLARDPLKVLMYHRFRDDSDPGYILQQSAFETHLEFIGKHFSVVDLDTYLAGTGNGKHRKPPLAITVDDGYQNFYEIAYPLLKRYGMPATVYIPYNFIENGSWLWQDKNIYTIRNTHRERFTFEYKGQWLEGVTTTQEQLFKTLLTIYKICAPLHYVQKEKLSSKLAAELEVDLSQGPNKEFRPMTWEMIRDLERNGIAIGSHTMNHTILTEVGPLEARREIRESKEALENRLGHSIGGFCYPNGDFNQAILNMVKGAGYRHAVTTLPGNNQNLSDHHYALRRFSPRDMPLHVFLYSIHSLRR